MNATEIIKAIEALTALVYCQNELWMEEKEVKIIKEKIIYLVNLL